MHSSLTTDLEIFGRSLAAVVDPAGRIRYKARGGTVHMSATRLPSG